ncbi:MAG TPA: hypothetical protein VLI05_03650 [Candidatus Saccharimonadia bacterium]|nr:hypothetical protein [Candidatus Saccharimonadia bacterium]
MRRVRRFGLSGWVAGVAAIGALILGAAQPAPARAEAGLQINPLKYEDRLAGSQIKAGHIDVANPGDAAVTIVTEVQGFRQVDLNGDLQFFRDDAFTAGIIPDQAQFELGPHESVRVPFSVNPAKLPRGGVYAAIFFRTVPTMAASSSSYIAESANVGTLLILNNGSGGSAGGRIAKADLPFWQLGAGLRGTITYQNTANPAGGVAVYPVLSSQVLPWDSRARLTGPFIMPGASRQFAFSRAGAYLGLLPVTLTDAATGRTVTRWVVACTGWWRLVLPLSLAVLICWLAAGRPRRSRPLGRLYTWFRRFRRFDH